MSGREEKRAYKRQKYSVPIEISYINKGASRSGQSLDHCEGGMCLASDLPFHLGATLNIRIKEFHPQGPCIGLCEGLRSVTLAEVKWCSQVADTDAAHYRVGIQFYAPVY